MVLLEQSKSCFLNFYSSYRNNIYKVDNTKLKQSTIQEKPEYNKLGFFKLTSVGSHRTDIYCDHVLNFCFKKTTCIGGCGCGCDTALYASPMPYSRIYCTAMDVLTVQYYGLKTLPVFWLVFVTFLYRIRCAVSNLNKL